MIKISKPASETSGEQIFTGEHPAESHAEARRSSSVRPVQALDERQGVEQGHQISVTQTVDVV